MWRVGNWFCGPKAQGRGGGKRPRRGDVDDAARACARARENSDKKENEKPTRLKEREPEAPRDKKENEKPMRPKERAGGTSRQKRE